MKRSEGKVALVTGASSGIGAATALSLKENGYIVYGAARRVERMKHLEKEGINILHVDLTKEQTIIGCIDTIFDREGRIDVLVNSAGFGKFGTIEETPTEIARAQYDVNVFGLVLLTQLVLPKMREQGSGKIVNISSVGGKIVTPFGGWYQSTKFAVEALSDALRMEVKPFGIDVIVIEPGGVESEWEGIASKALLEISGEGAYKGYAKSAAKAVVAGYKNASSPEVIANTIVKAVSAKKPKTRYAAGHRAKSFLVARWLFSDKFVDRMIMKEFMGNE